MQPKRKKQKKAKKTKKGKSAEVGLIGFVFKWKSDKDSRVFIDSTFTRLSQRANELRFHSKSGVTPLYVAMREIGASSWKIEALDRKEFLPNVSRRDAMVTLREIAQRFRNAERKENLLHEIEDKSVKAKLFHIISKKDPRRYIGWTVQSTAAALQEHKRHANKNPIDAWHKEMKRIGPSEFDIKQIGDDKVFPEGSTRKDCNESMSKLVDDEIRRYPAESLFNSARRRASLPVKAKEERKSVLVEAKEERKSVLVEANEESKPVLVESKEEKKKSKLKADPPSPVSYVYKLENINVTDGEHRIYIGETDNLEERMTSHYHQRDTSTAEQPFYWYMKHTTTAKWKMTPIYTFKNANAEERRAVEQMVIGTYPSDEVWNDTTEQKGHYRFHHIVKYKKKHWAVTKTRTYAQAMALAQAMQNEQDPARTSSFVISERKKWTAEIRIDLSSRKKETASFELRKHGGDSAAKKKAQDWLAEMVAKKKKGQEELANHVMENKLIHPRPSRA